MDFYASKFPVMLLTRTALQEWTKKGLYIMYVCSPVKKSVNCISEI